MPTRQKSVRPPLEIIVREVPGFPDVMQTLRAQRPDLAKRGLVDLAILLREKQPTTITVPISPRKAA